MNQPVTAKIASFGACLAAIILVLVPFHALLSVWIGSFYGVYDIARVWKELLMLVLAGPVLYLLIKDKQLWRALRAWPVFWLIVAYVGLHAVVGAYALISQQVTQKALLYGLVVNLRFVWFFLACFVIAAKSPWLRLHWKKMLFVPAALVVAFGLLQVFILPDDVLRHVGYGPDTIPAFQDVDQKEDFARVQSTLRGPNPLGAYLVLIIAGATAILFGQKNSKRASWAFGGLLAGSLVVLANTYSRSAYIGAVVAFGVACWLVIRSVKAKRILLVAAALLTVVGGTAAFVLRQNDQVQNVLFHTNEHSLSPTSSNEDRAGAIVGGVKDVVSEPFGRGPGTAGPSSTYNDGEVRIAENYYLQIAQEVGWLGLGLFAAIVLAIGWWLLKRKTGVLAILLLAGLVGISIVNLLSHAWTDDTISLLWWGLAGISLVPVILRNTSDESR